MSHNFISTPAPEHKTGRKHKSNYRRIKGGVNKQGGRNRYYLYDTEMANLCLFSGLFSRYTCKKRQEVIQHTSKYKTILKYLTFSSNIIKWKKLALILWGESQLRFIYALKVTCSYPIVTFTYPEVTSFCFYAFNIY